MKSHAFCALLAVALVAQSRSQQPEVTLPPLFTLYLSQGHRGAVDPHFQVLIVKMTNTSEQVMQRTSCDSFGEMYDLQVMYNGVHVKKTASELKYRKPLEPGPDSGSMVQESTGPGESRYDTLYYKTSKPGTYQFTVTRKSPLTCSDKGVTVKSNTITIVVPKDAATDSY